MADINEYGQSNTERGNTAGSSEHNQLQESLTTTGSQLLDALIVRLEAENVGTVATDAPSNNGLISFPNPPNNTKDLVEHKHEAKDEAKVETVVNNVVGTDAGTTAADAPSNNSLNLEVTAQLISITFGSCLIDNNLAPFIKDFQASQYMIEVGYTLEASKNAATLRNTKKASWAQLVRRKHHQLWQR